ncbi:hypothetical protein F5Y13DRAFT_77036 [Hypoxylon sp. FL1857]|nr:hypothetical protein F5Y13DRAFT_77036 [Hypoxylon sp. FL1857]
MTCAAPQKCPRNLTSLIRSWVEGKYRCVLVRNEIATPYYRQILHPSFEADFTWQYRNLCGIEKLQMLPLPADDIAAQSQPHSTRFSHLDDPVDNAHRTGESSLTGPGGELQTLIIAVYRSTKYRVHKLQRAILPLVYKISATFRTLVRPEIRLDVLYELNLRPRAAGAKITTLGGYTTTNSFPNTSRRYGYRVDCLTWLA